MDPFFLDAIVRELKERLAGARIDKIHQPEAETLIWRLWNREELRLLISVAPGRDRLHLTRTSWQNPPAPARFCQLLRARLARLEAVDKVTGERIIHFRCRGREGESYTLAAELIGTHADLVLVGGDGVIIDALRRHSSSGREFLPGGVYRLPEPALRISLAGEELAVPAGADSPKSFAGWLQESVSPMSSLVARELAAAVEQGEKPAAALARLRASWLAGDFRPGTARLEDKPVLLPFPLPHIPLSDLRWFDTPSEAAEEFFAELPGGGSAPLLRSELESALGRERRRLSQRVKKIEKDQPTSADGENRRRFGELLLANLHRVRRGMAEITVDDLFAEPPIPVTIPLDPRLAPQENAARFFRGYRKAASGQEHAGRRLAETRAALEWLEGAALALEEAESPAELEAVRDELEGAGILPPAARPPRRRPSVPPGIRRARTPGGYLLLWGKSHSGNDRVSRELAAPDDLWFHANGIPGAHLVLKREGKGEVPESDTLYAAAVAAGYSRGKDAAKVEVMVTDGKWVRRPKGARPGLVTVEKYRTVMVRPLRPEEPTADSRQPTADS